MQSAETIKATIQMMLCPTHDIYPHVHLSGNEIQIACCCPDFHQACIAEARKMLSEMNIPDLIIEE